MSLYFESNSKEKDSNNLYISYFLFLNINKIINIIYYDVLIFINNVSFYKYYIIFQITFNIFE